MHEKLLVTEIGLTAIITQHMLTYGLSLSPILAHFQKMPNILTQIWVSPGLRSENCEEDSNVPFTIPVHDFGESCMRISTCAYDEQEDKEQRLKVEDGGLLSVLDWIRSY